MSNAHPAMTMKSVSVTYHIKKPLGTSGATMSTFYNQTLKQADRAGVLRLNDEGKIAEIFREEVTINIPEGMYPEDIYTLDLLNPRDVSFRMAPSEILEVPLTESGIAGIDKKIL